MKLTKEANFGFNPRPKIHLIITMAMAVLTGVIALYLYMDAASTLGSSQKTNGVVINSIVSSSGMHTPVIQYSSANGISHEFKASFESSPQQYFEGDIVEVLIQGDNKPPKVVNFFTIYGISAFAACFSLVCVFGSVMVYFLRVRPMRPTR